MVTHWSLSNGPKVSLVSARLMYGVLMVCSLAMSLFMGGFVCLQLGLSLLATLFYAVAGKVLLLAFVLLSLLGVTALISALWREMSGYFSREMAAWRRLVAVQAESAQAAHRSDLEKRQLQYLSRLKRERLLAADSRKHLKVLYGAIRQELLAVKSQLPASTYKSLCKTLRKYHKQADAQAMLALRKQISCRE